MRKSITLGHGIPFIPEFLRDEEHFLFRRMADRDRALLFIGSVSDRDAPDFSEGPMIKDWTYGHLAYEWKEHTHGQVSRHVGPQHLEPSQWRVPQWVIEWQGGEAFLHAREQDLQAAEAIVPLLAHGVQDKAVGPMPGWTCSTTRERYLEQAHKLLRHIHRGDIYEVNYCTERHAAWPELDPYSGFMRLLKGADAPFAAFYRLGERFAICASPERFLSFVGDRCTGEPMKGTRRRGANVEEDARLRNELAIDAKERSENIMALDVMRNDLSRMARTGSVVVEGLCEVRSYPRVHQMVSTVAARIRPGHAPFDMVRVAFPMASMTGAPKISAMKLIDEAEDQARGLYSGSLGFFAPDGTGDLNVVIRTLLFDRTTGVASLSTGSALTAQCDPEQEWEECEVKARSVLEALAHA